MTALGSILTSIVVWKHGSHRKNDHFETLDATFVVRWSENRKIQIMLYIFKNNIGNYLVSKFVLMPKNIFSPFTVHAFYSEMHNLEIDAIYPHKTKKHSFIHFKWWNMTKTYAGRQLNRWFVLSWLVLKIKSVYIRSTYR